MPQLENATTAPSDYKIAQQSHHFFLSELKSTNSSAILSKGKIKKTRTGCTGRQPPVLMPLPQQEAVEGIPRQKRTDGHLTQMKHSGAFGRGENFLRTHSEHAKLSPFIFNHVWISLTIKTYNHKKLRRRQEHQCVNGVWQESLHSSCGCKS